jgi:shikimate dehydrogenase
MHAAAFRALGLPHSYEALRTTVEQLPGVIAELRGGTYGGLNVTVPHKERVLALVDFVDDSARTTRAANTLVRTPDGRVRAYNTDAPALAEELRVLVRRTELAHTRALVLGSGGAARAAGSALQTLGVGEVIVRARTRNDFAAQPWKPSRESETSTQLVVQATSAGMHGADPGEAVAGVVAWDALPDDAVALDVIYAPPETPFLRAARNRGLRHANGLGMLARQGALALELWLGVQAPLDAMLAALALNN